MTPDQFAYWLQGFAELNAAAPTQEQWQAIRDHLALVFDKRTPAIDATPRRHEPPQREEPPRRHVPPADEDRLAQFIRIARNRQRLRDLEPTSIRLC